jgi:chemotaxis protein methyltransferase CheR
MLTNEQFDRSRRLSLRLAGIELLERHRELLSRRLHRSRNSKSLPLDALLDAVEAGDQAAIEQFVGILTTNFTGFFRNPRHFEIAASHALAAVRARGHARLWSAAAATGEEAYSLAIALIEAFRRDDPPVTILATDINAASLTFARRGEYAEPALRVLNSEQRARFFTETSVANRWQIAETVRRLVQFEALNLADLMWPFEGPFDIIFCRNVLMYLESCHRYAVLERIASRLAPNGLLILDPAEHLGKAAGLFHAGAHAVYRRRGEFRPQPAAIEN